MADDEDRTLTLRRPRHHSSVSPPPIPTSKLSPNSPTASEFSVPRTLKGSVYSATGLLAYRSTPSVGSHMRGVSSQAVEAHRPRRRLKKKQRPVGMNLLNDSGVYEPEERIAEGEEQEVPPRRRSQSRPTTPSPEALPIVPPQSPNSRSSLKMLSRLNSVKKWRQRASTGPSEVIATEESKRPSTPNRPRSNSWFHKHTSPVLKPYKSKEQLRVVEEQTPKIRGNRSRSNTTGTIPRMPSASASDLLKGRDTPDVHRPSSMQPQARAVFPVSDAPQSEESQVTRSSSIRIKDQTTPRDSALPSDDKEGRRGLMGNVRRLSFGKHKRARSTAEVAVQYSPPPKEVEGAVERSGTAIFSMIRPSQEGTRPSTPAPLTDGAAPKTPVRQVQLQVPAPTSPQPGSLGRYATPNGAATPASLRRCSMGDLKIPSRISQAQDGIKRDLSLVKEFAACVEKLRNFQAQYDQLVRELRTRASRPSSPIQYHLPRPPSRSNRTPGTEQATNKAIRTLEIQYRNWWEAADVLINLGGAPPDLPSPNDPSPTENDQGDDRNFAGATPPSQWKGSTGKQDLSERQLVILSEMLDAPDITTSCLPEQSSSSLARQYPAGSAATLPSDEVTSPKPADHEKRKSHRLRGLKSIFRGFAKHRDDNSKRQTSNSTTLTTQSSTSELSSAEGHVQAQATNSDQLHPHFLQPHPEHVDLRQHPNSPYGTGISTDLPTKSPRRPSLASIFRVGHKARAEPSHAPPARLAEDNSGTDPDWDHMDNDSPVQKKRQNVNGSHTPKRQPSHTPVRRQRSATTQVINNSQVSLQGEPHRITSEQVPSAYRRPKSSRSHLKGDLLVSSTRPVPPDSFQLSNGDLRLVVTPENIPPLLSYARKVSSELDKCLNEARRLAPIAINS